VFRAESTGKKTISLPSEHWNKLNNLVDDGRMLTAGRNRTSLRNLRSAINPALIAAESTEAEEDDAGNGIVGRFMDTVYRLHISLSDAKPPIWRRVEVPDCSLAILHSIIQAAMGWYDGHLHQFTINHRRFSIPNPFGDDWGDAPNDSTDVWLSDVVDSEGFTFKYLYDFGDCWEHKIKVESIGSPDPSVRYPQCIKGKRRRPPEDCGGIWGYQELIEILSDPKHPEYDERVEWCGEIDPEEFDVTECTQQIRQWFSNAEGHHIVTDFNPQNFDINADLFDDDGEIEEDQFQAWSEHLQREFRASPEFDHLPDGNYGFVNCLIEYARDYVGVTPARMSIADLDEVLFDVVPRKVMAKPEDADGFIRELNAFF